jgi:hypothetical protein
LLISGIGRKLEWRAALLRRIGDPWSVRTRAAEAAADGEYAGWLGQRGPVPERTWSRRTVGACLAWKTAMAWRVARRRRTGNGWQSPASLGGSRRAPVCTIAPPSGVGCGVGCGFSPPNRVAMRIVLVRLGGWRNGHVQGLVGSWWAEAAPYHRTLPPDREGGLKHHPTPWRFRRGQ